MHTIDWPLDLTQSYLNIDTVDGRQVVRLDDDHQAVGKHSMLLDADQAWALAAAHHAMGEALNFAAAALTPPATTGVAPAPLPPLAPPID